MGNSLGKIPLLVVDNILDHLRLQDAMSLMACGSVLRKMISANRHFWVHHALRLYEIDPAKFMRLKSHHLYDEAALVRHVTFAHLTYLATVGNILAGDSEDTAHDMEKKIITIAIDEVACRIAVHLDFSLVQIHSLLRLRDPPLRSVRLTQIHHMVLHGDILFYRFSHDPSKFHTDVYNWRIGLPMASLTPGSNDIGAARLKFSDRFLIAFNHPEHCSLAYQLDDVGYRIHPFRVPLPPAERMNDQATKGDLLLVLLEIEQRHVYHEINILNNQVLKTILVASPRFLYSPKIAPPYILVTQVNRFHHGHQVPAHVRRSGYTYGPRILIPGPDDSVKDADPIFASGGVKSPSFRGQFIFIADGRNEHSKIVYVGDHSLPFRFSNIAEHVYHGGPCAPGIVSFGLSVVFVRGSLLVLRKYFDNGELFM